MKLLLCGGQQKASVNSKKEWTLYQKGVIVRIDCTTGIGETCVEYTTPPEYMPDKDASIVFKSGSLVDDVIYTCTQTEVIGFRLPDFEQVVHISLPHFNDLHHVRKLENGNFQIANTGLDMVCDVSPDGDLVNAWNVLKQEPWHKFSPEIDYRKVLTTKPHASHPNYTFELPDGSAWVTRFEQRDAVDLNSERRITIDIERPHDGVVHGEHVYFTTVDGHIVIANCQTLETQSIIDLNTFDSQHKDLLLGWTRGIHIIDEDRIIVAFSRIRSTKFKSNIRWALNKLKNTEHLETLPTRIACFNLKDKNVMWEHDLEPYGMNAIFSLHLLDETPISE